jgi:hypothetical protein
LPQVVPTFALVGVQALQVHAVGEPGLVSQSCKPPLQSASEWQTPVTQPPFTQIFPALHCVSAVQSVQVRETQSRLPEQFAALVQLPVWQSPSVSQTWPEPHCGVLVQALHWFATQS